MKTSYKFFQNRDCEYFPCHLITDDRQELNCLFCFCPLYSYDNCGGNFQILSNGLKDCSNCLIPHKDYGYDYIVDKLKEYNKEKQK